MSVSTKEMIVGAVLLAVWGVLIMLGGQAVHIVLSLLGGWWIGSKIYDVSRFLVQRFW